MLVNVKVKPNSSQEKIIRANDNNYEVWLKENPVNNKANIRLLRLLKKHFKKDVKIKFGLTLRKKIVEVIEK